MGPQIKISFSECEDFHIEKGGTNSFRAKEGVNVVSFSLTTC